MRQRAELLFTEVQNALIRISEKILGEGSQNGDIKSSELSRFHVAELKSILQKEKAEFEVHIWQSFYSFSLLPH